ncbi:hypothetical protein PBY51_022904 [Eleginops maclovinus]|uniref:Uncharacterized protein n=1 Tax=Eleginops maclovinus TaxID=56733 RepID=A0AAN7XE00_ELEMC|nr:hypothetical protein PBY51_022904 [Eleginops maclovinus]
MLPCLRVQLNCQTDEGRGREAKVEWSVRVLRSTAQRSRALNTPLHSAAPEDRAVPGRTAHSRRVKTTTEEGLKALDNGVGH